MKLRTIGKMPTLTNENEVNAWETMTLDSDITSTADIDRVRIFGGDSLDVGDDLPRVYDTCGWYSDIKEVKEEEKELEKKLKVDENGYI